MTNTRTTGSIKAFLSSSVEVDILTHDLLSWLSLLEDTQLIETRAKNSRLINTKPVL
jgi:hypothetical protein